MRKSHGIWIVAAAFALVVSACGGGTTSTLDQKPVTIKGSDTMVILVQTWAENYMNGHPGKTIQVTGGGSGVGIAALINGSTDICAASRPMKDSEKAQVRSQEGQDVKEIPVALDGLTIYVHKSSPVESLSEEQLKGIYTGRITSWRDVGGKDEKIVAYGRDNSSGTYVFFKEHVLGNEDFAREVQTLPGTGAIVNAVSKDPASIGYGGIGYASGIQIVALRRDPQGKGVTPSLETVRSGEYPLSRNLFFYTAGEPVGNVKSFIDWVLSPEGQRVCEKTEYYPIATK